MNPNCEVQFHVKHGHPSDASVHSRVSVQSRSKSEWSAISQQRHKPQARVRAVFSTAYQRHCALRVPKVSNWLANCRRAAEPIGGKSFTNGRGSYRTDLRRRAPGKAVRLPRKPIRISCHPRWDCALIATLCRALPFAVNPGVLKAPDTRRTAVREGGIHGGRHILRPRSGSAFTSPNVRHLRSLIHFRLFATAFS